MKFLLALTLLLVSTANANCQQFFTPFNDRAMPDVAESYLRAKQMKQNMQQMQQETERLKQEQRYLEQKQRQDEELFQIEIKRKQLELELMQQEIEKNRLDRDK